MRRAFVGAALVLAVGGAAAGAAAAGGGLGLSVGPARLSLAGAARASVTVRNPGSRPLRVYVSRAGLASSLRGRPRVAARRGAADWLRVRPLRLRIPPHAAARLRVAESPPPHAAPGDYPALILLTTRPPGAGRVRVLVRVGVPVLVHVPGPALQRLDPCGLAVRRLGARRLLELRLVNRGSALEQLGGGRVRIVLSRAGRTVAVLRLHRRELLPHSTGVVEAVYRGSAHGIVLARVELPRAVRGRRRSFRIRL